MSQSLKHVKSSDVAPEHSFLIEERIAFSEQDCFTKFVHNGSAEPNLYPNDSGYQTSLFLCACQHLQYEKTHQMAFVSDFQGYNNLLTDAQILTSPYVVLIFPTASLLQLISILIQRALSDHLRNRG